MIDIMTRSALGKFGSILIDYYRAHSLPINLFIFLIFALFLLSKWAYGKAELELKSQLNARFGGGMIKNAKNFEAALKKTPIDWVTLSKSSFMPLIIYPGDKFFKVKSVSSLKNYFTAERMKSVIDKAQSV